jgi:5-methyltetrahydrofolate--homocysteine methyltransferase
METMELLQEIASNLENGEDEKVAELTSQAIDAGVAPGEILGTGLLAGMRVVGERFRIHEIFLPEVLLAARAMQTGVDLLKPLLIEEGVPTIGKVVIGSVRGDLHDIGKNLVGIMLKGAGFEVIDLGNDVPPQSFVDTAVEVEAPIIGLSALITTTMSSMKEVCDLLEERGLRGRIKTMVGGAPLSQELADEMGADAYGYDAANAVERAKALLGVA